MKKALCLLLAILTLLSVAVPGMAASKPRLMNDTLWTGCDLVTSVNIENLPNGAKITSVKSSKPSVLKVRKETGGGETQFFLQPLKAGKSTLTVVFKVKKKSTTLKAVYTVKKYPNPLKSLSVNGKTVSLKKYRREYSLKPYKKAQATIKAVAAKGWKIRSMDCSVNYAQPFTVKNGKAFKFAKGSDTYVDIMLANGSGETFEYFVGFNH